MNQKYKRTAVWLPLVIAATLCVGIWVGARFLGRYMSGDETVFDKIQTIMGIVESQYVDEVNTDSLLEKAIPDILAQLDPHTVYIPAADLQGINDELEGSFSGIGISFNMSTDTITVLEVISGGPSERVGILAGDRIIAINDTIVAGKKWTQDNVMKHLRGPKDSEVKLGVKRNNSEDLLDFTVVRGDIPVTSIDACYMITPNVGMLKINRFAKNTYAEFLNSMVKLKANGADNVIIDLRGNGGGYMEPAVLMAKDFLDAGDVIVSTKGRPDGLNGTELATATGAFSDMGLTVVIDEFSASASEIFAGAIQDNDRGLIIGRRSFGKGLVQDQIPLPDGSAVRLTIARYYTPSGRCIQKNFTPGAVGAYQNEIADRYARGEGYSADSIKLDKSQQFKTVGGRTVYGGGGIMPDIYVEADTTDITSYYISIFNAGLLQKFAFKYADENRAGLGDAKDVSELMVMLPSDDSILTSFVEYARREAHIAPRWFYINKSRSLIVSQLKALIARDLLDTSAYFEVSNENDPTIQRVLKELE